MIRKATATDLAALDAFLYQHLETTMFSLDNLRNHGLNKEHPRSPEIWWWPDETGAVAGAFSVTREGMVMPQCPACTDWAALAHLVSGRKLLGCLGPDAQVRAFVAAAGLRDRATAIASPEPLMQCDLSADIAKDAVGELRPLQHMPRDLAVAWRAAYNLTLLGTPEEDATRSASADIERYIQQDSHRAFFIDGVPCAMTGFNARVADMVQIGGVYTPPKWRGKGYAGHALRHHLAEAFSQGARRAVLFAASETAMGVYERVGFTHIGQYTLHIFKKPETCP